jgi:amino acid adenylation domain-containing protein
MRKGADAVIALQGVNLAGEIYVPLDAGSPTERLTSMLAQLEPIAYVVDLAGKDRLIQCGVDPTLIFVFGEIRSKYERLKVEAWQSDVIDCDPCYILFTSGSTGTPKGVTISHRSIIDYIEWADSVYKLKENDIVGNQAPLFFDNSTLDLYFAFKVGAGLDIIDEALFMFPHKLMSHLESRAVTFIFWVPSILSLLVGSGALAASSHRLALKNVLFAGEVMPAGTLKAWMAELPDAVFSNLYGPTEITVDCTYYIVPQGWNGDAVPIGRACRNSDVLIIDDHGNRCVSGQAGELCVRGSSLALGYWGDVERTQKVFVQNPLHSRYNDLVYRTGDIVSADSDGVHHFIGRRDGQIKRHGYRIELGEIEAVASKVSGLANCCVIYDEVSTSLILAYESEKDVSAQDLRKLLVASLPKYMVPSRFERLELMPRLGSGKLDRFAIREQVVGS